jgi:hypothetical protein
MYSPSSGAMHELLFGGISLQYFDETTQAIETDFGLPFVNDVTSIVIDDQGNYSQHHLGFFPEFLDQTDMRLRFGTNSEFLLAGGVPTFENGVINLDALSGETTVGFIYGGIASNAPHTRFVPGAQSAASNRIFEVVVTVVPEPAGWQLIAVGAASAVGLAAARRGKVGTRAAS